MSAAQELTLTLLVLVVIESLRLIAPGEIVFTRFPFFAWRFFGQRGANDGATPESFLSATTILPLTERFYRSPVFPISISDTHITNFPALAMSNYQRSSNVVKSFAIATIENVAVSEGVIWINGTIFTDCGSPELAESVGKLIHKVKNAASDRRKETIKYYLRKSLDSGAVSKRREQIYETLTALSVAQVFLFVLVFLAIPLLAFTDLLASRWPTIVAVLILSQTATTIFCWRANKVLFHSSGKRRLLSALYVLAYPPAALTSPQRLTERAFPCAHPLALGATLLNRKDLITLARRLLAPLLFTLEHELPESDDAIRTVRSFRHIAVEVYWESLRQAGIQETDITAPPEQDSSSNAYCPRCRQQFTVKLENCPDCRTMRLENYL